MAALKKQPLERFYYWQGQRLRSGDFNRIAEDNAQRRWWHNRALHNAFGIYRGFEVAHDAKLEHLTVSPGLAYDRYGRELILPSPRTIHVPNLKTTGTSRKYFSLTLRFSDPSCSCQAGPPAALCFPGASRDTGNVTLSWHQANSNPSDDGIVIALLTLEGGRPRLPKFFPNRARPFARPLLASGSTIPGATAWQPWSPNLEISTAFSFASDALGIQVKVDTSAAGFTSIPCYFAWLHGPLWNSVTHEFFPAFFPSLDDESTTGFTFRLLFSFERHQWDVVEQTRNTGARTIANFDQFLRYAERNDLYVAWLGCQMPPEVPFVPVAQDISTVTLLNNILTQAKFR
jgi:hypothetical protein